MVDRSTREEKPDAGGSRPEAETGEATAGSTVNQQILDSLTALAASGGGGAPEHVAAMLSLASAHSGALGMYNAVARQQADAAIASAAVAASCVRMMGAGLPPVPPVPPGEAPSVLVAAAEVQAAAGVQMLHALAAQSGDPAGARAALERIAEAAAAPLAAAGVQEERPAPSGAKGRRRRAPAGSKPKG